MDIFKIISVAIMETIAWWEISIHQILFFPLEFQFIFSQIGIHCCITDARNSFELLWNQQNKPIQ